MANKNKNILRLFARTDDDPVGDIPGYTSDKDDNFSSVSEVDELTYDTEDDGQGRKSRTALHNALAEQTKLAEELRFEVEHLRNKQRGFEEELKARSEITANINSEIRESRSQLNKSVSTLETREVEIQANLVSLEKANALTERLQTEARNLEFSTKELKSKIASLESRLGDSEKNDAELQARLSSAQQLVGSQPKEKNTANDEFPALKNSLKNAYSELGDLRSYIDGRKETWLKVNAELDRVRNELIARNNEVENLSGEVERQASQLALSQENYALASRQLTEQQTRTKELDKEIGKLEFALNHDAEKEITACRAQITELSGTLAAQSHELECLRKDNGRIQKYSDSLRIQLQDQSIIAKTSVAMRQELESGLDAANETIRNLADELDETREKNRDKADTIEILRTEYEREIRQVRFELGAAEDTLAGQETINGQLASDLIDNKGYREALETQLTEVEKESSKTIRDLTGQLQRAKQDADDYARKLRIKDRAITDLMKELSNYTTHVETEDNLENVFQKIDGYKSDANEHSDLKTRERVARLLIGKPGGRELRFPLFKDRLTIGRTSYNDIQLNMQYVSRRHAVISTEQGRTRVIDWGSKNGVFVNNKRITEHFLESGDKVSIGTADFKYEERPKR